MPSAPAEPRATGDLAPRRNLAPLWSDEYFIVGNHPGEQVQVRVKSNWKDSLAIDWPMTRQCQPSKFGEERDNPVRCLLVLRGWTLWRAHVDGWATSRSCRANHFIEQQTLLERDVKALHAPCGLLGNAEANAEFVMVAPRIAARLQATGGAVATGG